MEAKPLLFGSFQETDAEDRPVYAELPGYEELRRVLNSRLAEYNETNTSMDLVLFQQASSCSLQSRYVCTDKRNGFSDGVPMLHVPCLRLTMARDISHRYGN